jgi:hypothetical protein
MSFFKDNLRNQHGGCVATLKPIVIKPEWNHSAKRKITDEQVREMRYLHEVKHVSISEIIRKFAPLCDVLPDTIIKILNYGTRLSPKCEINYKPK